MMLAVTGIFGLASYTVSKRMRELGIRVALGAGRNRSFALHCSAPQSFSPSALLPDSRWASPPASFSPASSIRPRPQIHW